MDSEHVLLHVMTDLKSNRNSIAKFQNAITSQLLPPIGVFWDIENIQVPKGKSASALVNAIRERFFKEYREAEFMCVCDINKENKAIIHELNDAQVTVVHVDATSKNAADEKLRQCMRRFVDTHGSPATLLLISDDVNFATDLSDFRHRRHVKIVLLHRTHAPEPLLACAHEHHNFNDLAIVLPWRSPQKQTNCRPKDLVVTDLPLNHAAGNIKKCLRRLSDNCGGKVVRITKSKAIVSFANSDAAERAQKRMNKQAVYGSQVTVSFLQPNSSDYKDYILNRNLCKENGACSSMSSRDSSPHFEPPHSSEEDPKKPQKTFSFPAPPVFNQNNLPNILKSPSNSDKNLKPLLRTKEDILSNININDTKRFFNGTTRSNTEPWFFTSYNDLRLETYGYHPHLVNGVGGNLKTMNSAPNVLFGMQHMVKESDREVLPPVDLLVTNLDQSIEINEMKKILQCAFREHVMVLHISMMLQPDGNVKAVVRVPTLQDAQYAISQLQRQKIGHKRILLSHTTNDKGPPFSILKSEVVQLLKDIPSKILPIFKFREMYEKRYNRAISVSELYKMRDVVNINEEATGRTVGLNSDYRTSSSTDNDSLHSQELAMLEKPYCELHFHPSQTEGWAEQQCALPLPDLFISLKTFSPAVHTLLDTHQGSLPLSSFCACYEADIGPLPVVAMCCMDSTTVSLCETSSQQRGIPIEHLISCVAGVEISKSRLSVKKVQWCENKTTNQQGVISPALAGPLALFGREMMDLLRTQPRCIVLFNKFIPIYHHHFGRQCRVADYGFTKLIDLLEAIPHIIQVFGDGQNRLVTLTHRMQIKRFAADLLRILKSRASKQLLLSEFAELYHQSTEKQFEITNYGVCDINDMLVEISESTVVVTMMESDTVIAIPKRDQTPEEIEKTLNFTTEVVELFKHTPNCSMLFNKFIPSYHHHFGKQCRVADYGFTKLIELFEAIPIIEITGSGEDKVLNLAQKERNEILADRLVAMLKNQPDKVLALHMLGPAYVEKFGHVLRPADFDASDMIDLIRKLGTCLKVVDGYAGAVVKLVDEQFIHEVCLRMCRLLMEEKSGSLPIETLNYLYKRQFGHSIDIHSFKTELEDCIKIESGIAKLTPLQLCIREFILIVQDKLVPMTITEFEQEYFKTFRMNIQPQSFGFQNTTSMLQSLRDYFVICRKRKKNTVLLRRNTAGSRLVVNGILPNEQSLEAVQKDDIMNDPIPSGVPSPELEPQNSEENLNLMGFETPVSEAALAPPTIPPKMEAPKTKSHSEVFPFPRSPNLPSYPYFTPYNTMSGPFLNYFYRALPSQIIIPSASHHVFRSWNAQSTPKKPKSTIQTSTPLRSNGPNPVPDNQTGSKENVSPVKIAKMSPSNESQVSVAGRRSASIRIAARFSCPIE